MKLQLSQSIIAIHQSYQGRKIDGGGLPYTN